MKQVNDVIARSIAIFSSSPLDQSVICMYDGYKLCHLNCDILKDLATQLDRFMAYSFLKRQLQYANVRGIPQFYLIPFIASASGKNVTSCLRKLQSILKNKNSDSLTLFSKLSIGEDITNSMFTVIWFYFIIFYRTMQGMSKKKRNISNLNEFQ